ncbi:MAG: HPP family protein [Paracoccaceae bacterium]
MSLWRALGPAMPRAQLGDALRSAVGAGLGLALTGAGLTVLAGAGGEALAHPLLIAPFGASALLIFVVPNSPLAQPWSVIVGNGLAAAVALLVLQLGLPPLATDGLAVLLAILAMALARALHPPSGAVALFTALVAPEASLAYLWSPVILGSLGLVLAGMVWNRAVGRVYPFRQPAPSPHGTTDPAPERRHLPPPGALTELLSRLRLEANIGVEDLTRLITAAEAEAATRPLAGLTAQHLMSHDLVTALPSTSLDVLAQQFHAHSFKTLPMVDTAGQYLGLVTQQALVGLANPLLTAADLAHPTPYATYETPAADLVQRLADGREQAVPIVEAGRLVGLVTRSDLIALLARALPS